MSDFLSIPSLASRLGVTPPAVRDWIEQGEIDASLLLEATGEAGPSPHHQPSADGIVGPPVGQP